MKNNNIPEDKEKNKISKIFYIIVLLEIIMFFFAIFNTKNLNIKMDYILYSNIGFLTFIAIFYGLFFSDKTNLYLDMINSFKSREKQLITHFKKQKNNINSPKDMEKFIEDINERIDNNKFAQNILKINWILYFCAMSFIFGIITILVNLTKTSTFFLLIGIIFLIHIITTWAFINYFKNN